MARIRRRRMRCVRLGLHHRTCCRHGMCRCRRAAPCMALTHCMRCTESAQSAALPVSVAFLVCRGRRIAAHRIASHAAVRRIGIGVHCTGASLCAQSDPCDSPVRDTDDFAPVRHFQPGETDPPSAVLRCAVRTRGVFYGIRIAVHRLGVSPQRLKPTAFPFRAIAALRFPLLWCYL